ncbi:unnamed protein product [Hymenolepis diminuta]|uniref:Secreted protein n=1 Tax=Hymenolepis diminuta TaxID=6216 RepID=A0A564Z654_HYMDI|nr:unnamed protein product [Hymenolepis diminuta]
MCLAMLLLMMPSPVSSIQSWFTAVIESLPPCVCTNCSLDTDVYGKDSLCGNDNRDKTGTCVYYYQGYYD